jgi:hypothetical protein
MLFVLCVPTLLPCSLSLPCAVLVLCRALSSVIAVNHIFAVRSCLCLLWPKSLPCVFSSCKEIFAVRFSTCARQRNLCRAGTHGKDTVHGNGSFSRSGLLDRLRLSHIRSLNHMLKSFHFLLELKRIFSHLLSIRAQKEIVLHMNKSKFFIKFMH